MTGPLVCTSVNDAPRARAGALNRTFQWPFKAIRVAYRFCGFCLLCAVSWLDYLWNVRRHESQISYRLRASWLARWSRVFVRLLNIEVTCHGTPPVCGVIAANHLSYLDIVVLGSSMPMIFVSKSEVARWPGLGPLTRCAGTLYINREKRADVKDLAKDFASVVDQGQVLALFPEGTSSDGSTVMVFHSSLFEAPAQEQWPVTAAWLGYSLEHGSAAEEVCYWRDMTFLPHFLNLLSKKSIQATVAFGGTLETGLNRKAMATALRRQVLALAARHRGGTPSQPSHGAANADSDIPTPETSAA